MAQGQAMISTDTPATRARASFGSGPAMSQAAAAAAAMASTMGTNTRTTRSAIDWIGSLAPWARSTISTMRARTVSAPTRSARKESAPSALTEPPITASPGPLATGRGSPVRALSSTCDSPRTISPSAGTRSPGRSRTMSPTRSRSTGISEIAPSRSIRAVGGRSPISLRTASPVCPLARASSQRPSRTSAMMAAAASK